MSWLDPFNIVGGAKDALFPDPSKASMKYLNNLEPMYHQYYDPYVEQGNRISPELEEQYRLLMQNPNMAWDKMAQSYQQSPGYQFQYNQAMNAANNAAAAGGMLGTGAHQQARAQMGSDLANQDFYNYMSQLLGQKSQGLAGMQGLQNQGYGAATGLAGNLGNLAMNKAGLKYQGQASQNQSLGSLLGGLSGIFF